MLNEEIISELEIIGHRGAENASAAISTFLNRKLTIRITDVTLRGIDNIQEALGQSEKLSVALLLRVTGEIEGNSLLIMSEDDAVCMVRFLGADSAIDSAAEFSEIEHSMLEETANITVSSFMNGLASHLDKKCIPNAPIYIHDMAGAILSVVVMETAELSDQALIFETAFESKDSNLQAMLLFLPSPSSFDLLQKGITNE
jgi:chemotaxis protein CheY-P-specific phosphatase CheC